ncbi:alpha/beta hydrolase [Methylobacterium sp. J-030]|uniref:alpha/beta fold hydrolase n=1 Tax=Methylobacterium sp. J-030 TaxID=2836627 RepID=UPI001FBB115A|nr:alpha/beta hydrolase [Methylobacterium sp. J-030]MCJ2068663.1 alpha/beta hydrolase [Methylobacterium sp. J-030]
MHTVRTQLDLFQFVVPRIAPHFTVYAFDLPGFGWSDIRDGAIPDEPSLRAKMKEALALLALTRPILVGESIGATLSLSIAADLGQGVARVVAFNTYDYLPGLERANLLASVIVKSVRAPIIGPVFAALENRPILAGIMSGGVYDPKSWPADLLDEFNRVGKRKGYPAVARGVMKALPSFVAAQASYSRIRVPVTLVWGEMDWSSLQDRAAVERAVPAPKIINLGRSGHFISVEKPEDFADIVVEAANRRPIQ